MGGKHRLGDPPPPHKIPRLVCIYFGEPCGEPSAIRDCRTCGRQLCVAMLMLPLVEAGELAPTCRACNGDRPVTMHPLEEEWLTERGLAEEGWEEIKAINDSLKAPEINP